MQIHVGLDKETGVCEIMFQTSTSQYAVKLSPTDLEQFSTLVSKAARTNIQNHGLILMADKLKIITPN